MNLLSYVSETEMIPYENIIAVDIEENEQGNQMSLTIYLKESHKIFIAGPKEVLIFRKAYQEYLKLIDEISTVEVDSASNNA